MKILALNGSYRGKTGNTQWLLDKIAEGATAAGAEFETVVLAEQRIIRCAGCETCHTAEHYLQCIYENEDDVKAILDRMKAADILVYATPVYVFNLSGLMKTFLERLNSTVGTDALCVTDSGLFFGRVDKAFHSKPFVILTCCGNVEAETAKNVVSYFKTFAKFLDAPIVGVLVRKSIGAMEEAKIVGVKPLKPVITDVANAFIQAGRELATQGKITAGTQRKANQHILGIPFLDWLMKFRLFKKIAVKNKR
jgi:multimeric flavodoxin WrbA